MQITQTSTDMGTPLPPRVIIGTSNGDTITTETTKEEEEVEEETTTTTKGEPHIKEINAFNQSM